MLFRTDVINLMGKHTVLLWELAIFASAPRPRKDQFTPEFGHGLRREARFLEGKASFGVEEVDEFADAQKLLERDPFVGRDGAAVVFLQELANAFDSALVELEIENGASGVRRQSAIDRGDDVLQNLRF